MHTIISSAHQGAKKKVVARAQDRTEVSRFSTMSGTRFQNIMKKSTISRHCEKVDPHMDLACYHRTTRAPYMQE